MRTLSFQLTLLSDAVISASAATAGGHQSLEYLPGSTLLGMAAARIYEPGSADTEIIFHSQRVRFGDARATSSEPSQTAPTAPAPRSLFHPKDDERATLGNVAAGWTIEPAHKNLRQGHVVRSTGQKVATMEHRTAMKTAVDASTGRARDGHLFTYDTLAAGAVFHFQIDLDSDVPTEIDGQLQDALTRGTVRVGRSRSAEFGKARIETISQETNPVENPGATDTVILWALSDLALRDPETGAPTRVPRPEHFGLPATACFDGERSVLTSRRYSPFHGHRRRPDLERQVIERGSVMVFRDVQGADLAAVSTQISAGVGDYREAGCGSVCFAPAWLQQPQVQFAEAGATPRVESLKAPADDMFQILQARHQRLERERGAIDLCRLWEDALIDHFPPQRLPGNSQWGLWRSMAASAKDWPQLRGQLFGTDGLLSRGVRQKAWMAKFRGISVMDHLLDQIETAEKRTDTGSDPATHLRALRLLGARMPKRLTLARKKGGSR
jgi:CRISPR-associated protein Csx10